VGQPLDDLDLRQRLAELLDEASALLGGGLDADAGTVGSFAGAEQMLTDAFDRADQVLEAQRGKVTRDLRPIVALVRRLAGLQRELGAAELAHRSRAFGLVQGSLARLRSVSTVAQMLELIPVEVCRCGFSRAFLSRIHEGRWVPESCHIDGDSEWAAEIVRVGREHPQSLDHLNLETEMVRRRGAILVRDVQRDPRVHRPIADVSLSHSYAAAPIMPNGRVVGFIHADCHVTPREVDDFDLDVLWMLAEGLGYAFERTVLAERQRALREQVREATTAINGIINAHVDADLQVARLELDTVDAVRTAAAPFVAPESRLYMLLTRRELEVARLIAAGRTNPQIAAELVISETTVKSHVSQVLRKLRVANRAQAASKYMTLAGPEAR
jgi:DNA-binding CsgD family transcriptional regulator/GAF domain-containing protein